MKRKIVKHGEATLTISLPAKWVKKLNLKQGEELEVEEEKNKLIISRSLDQKERSITIKISPDSNRYVRSYIGRLYREGYTTIIAEYQDSKTITAIKSATSNLMGAEIIKTEINKCTIKVFPVEDLEINIEEYLRKMLMTLMTIFDILNEDLIKGKYDRHELLEELRNNNWQTRDLILRKASLNSFLYEYYNSLATMTFCYEKLGTKINGFYKRHIKISLDAKKRTSSLYIKEGFKEINSALSWLIEKVSQKKEVSLEEETSFRDSILSLNLKILKLLHENKAKEADILTIIYFSLELLDATVSYLSEYKKLQK
ncbi:MAG: AbrB/MazE/SpoVT family DNA-binding domain-containing protein [Candidatus Woesearchaeota archaeon]